MKVYIAARFFEKNKVREIYKQLTDKGHTISADWTVHLNAKPYDKNRELSRDYAIEDINGVKDCDIFILITSEEIGAGTSTELGAAIMSHITRGKPKIYIVGEYISKNFCFFHPSVIHRTSINDVLKEI